MTDDLWEAHADWWVAGFTEGADPEYVEQIVPMAAEHLAGAGSVLDVGTGDGQLARLAMRGGASTVIGVDPTRAQLAVARGRGGGPHYARATAEALPFRAECFDAAVACLVFEHIPSFEAALAEVGRVLRP